MAAIPVEPAQHSSILSALRAMLFFCSSALYLFHRSRFPPASIRLWLTPFAATLVCWRTLLAAWRVVIVTAAVQWTYRLTVC